MDRRDFLKTSLVGAGALAGAGMLARQALRKTISTSDGFNSPAPRKFTATLTFTSIFKHSKNSSTVVINVEPVTYI